MRNPQNKNKIKKTKIDLLKKYIVEENLKECNANVSMSWLTVAKSDSEDGQRGMVREKRKLK
jgi:hypothetical protein